MHTTSSISFFSPIRNENPDRLKEKCGWLRFTENYLDVGQKSYKISTIDKDYATVEERKSTVSWKEAAFKIVSYAPLITLAFALLGRAYYRHVNKFTYVQATAIDRTIFNEGLLSYPEKIIKVIDDTKGIELKRDHLRSLYCQRLVSYISVMGEVAKIRDPDLRGKTEEYVNKQRHYKEKFASDALDTCYNERIQLEVDAEMVTRLAIQKSQDVRNLDFIFKLKNSTALHMNTYHPVFFIRLGIEQADDFPRKELFDQLSETYQVYYSIGQALKERDFSLAVKFCDKIITPSYRDKALAQVIEYVAKVNPELAHSYLPRVTNNGLHEAKMSYIRGCAVGAPEKAQEYVYESKRVADQVESLIHFYAGLCQRKMVERYNPHLIYSD